MYDHLDKLVELATSERYIDRVRGAKQKFFRATGEVFEEDEFYESRMKGFVEFYLFDFEGPDTPPFTVDLILQNHESELSAKEMDTFLKFRRGVHSLFELKKQKGEVFTLVDLYDAKKYQVTERRAMHGVSKKDIFEARLLPFEEKLFFSNAFVFHPREVKKFIVKELERARSDKAPPIAALHTLANLRLKFDRYRGMDARKVYSDASTQLLERKGSSPGDRPDGR